MSESNEKSINDRDTKTSNVKDDDNKTITLHIPIGGELGHCDCHTCCQFFGHKPSSGFILPPIVVKRGSCFRRRYPVPQLQQVKCKTEHSSVRPAEGA